MAKNLVIVESPAKAKTIERFLGKDFKVMSSFGHISDLPSNGIGVDIENDFSPQYVISDDKKALVRSLAQEAKKSEFVWLASDEDREGEAISWHLFKELHLREDNTKRIVFNSITKSAIEKAIENPRGIDYNLVDAQQARRVLDRLVGYELSPVLWKKIKTGLSAGRVQSVSVRLIVEREREIQDFEDKSTYRVVAEFYNKDNKIVKAKLDKDFETKAEALEFLHKNKNISYFVDDITTKPTKRSPAPAFTTSTLQQEASRKLGFSVSRTMQVAQRLYENGIITYMRTDSVNLSSEAIGWAEREIKAFYGEKYSHPRNFSTHSKGAQEAHEAIRPTDMSLHSYEGERDQKRLYDLIWKRTIASQMSDAQMEKTNIKIKGEGLEHMFVATGEVVTFDGFLKVYTEGKDEEEEEQETMLPLLKKGEELWEREIVATQRFTRAPYRYTEASLVKKLEELGIGRPSTYAPTISTIQNRGYVEKSDISGQKRQYVEMTLKQGKIEEKTKVEIVGGDKGKLIPTDIGMVVNDFLVLHFNKILDYNFTANVEKDFDNIAEGKLNWQKMMKNFYREFHPNVVDVEKNAERETGQRTLGIDPKTGKKVIVRLGRYGAMAQIGDADEEKPKYASLVGGMTMETITLEDALKLFELPRKMGVFQGKEMEVSVGRFGPYVRLGDSFISMGKDKDVYSITLEEVKEIVLNKQKEDAPIGKYKGLDVTKGKGRFGPFIKWGDTYINVSKKYDFDNLSQENIKELIEDKLKKEREKVVKQWGNIKLEKARWGRYALVEEDRKVELSKDTDIESFTLEMAQKILEKEKEKTTAKKTIKKTTKKK